ncbi:hypothetical protein [Rhizobium sp. No.120]
MISLMDVQRGYDDWAAQPHNKKWVKRLDGTPIANDIVVRIFEALKDASPAPLPVAVEDLEWNGAGNNIYASTPFGPYAIRHNTTSLTTFPLELVIPGEKVATQFFYFEDRAKAAAQADYESRIRSALSSPVGGMEERPPLRISAHEYAMEYEFRADEGDYAPTDGERAMIEDAINGFLGENEISPTPASDIAALQKAFDQRTDKLLELVEENGLLKGRAATNEQALASYKSEIAALKEENRRLRNKVPARALTDSQLDDEAAAIDEVMAGGFGEGGGSPGEWWYERADEIAHERKRRQLEKELAEHNRAALQHVAKGER